MRKLINIQDVRNNAKQIGKQINEDSFNAYLTRIQKRQLQELLGQALFYDFFNFLDNSFTNYSGTFTYSSETTFIIEGVDVTAWNGYSLRINENIFVIITNAVLSVSDTVLTVTGYDVPENIESVAFSSETKYIELLNGCTYEFEGNNILFDGLRGFLSYHWIASYLIDGDLKQNDKGNFQITGDLFQGVSSGAKNMARAEYLENALDEYNKIVQYLDINSSDFTLWESKNKENLNSLTYGII